MKLLVLMGQRKEQYEGQYALEALAVIDEISDSDNPDYIDAELKKYTASGEFDALAVVCLSVSEKAVREVLYPAARTLPATVANSETPSQIENLKRVALNQVAHIYQGRCPDHTNEWNSRDPDCPACQLLASANP